MQQTRVSHGCCIFFVPAYIVEMNKRGMSVNSDFATISNCLNEAQRVALQFLEKLMSGQFDEHLRASWVEIKGDMADSPQRVQALIAGCEELSAKHQEIVHACDHLNKDLARDGISMDLVLEQRSADDAEIPAKWYCQASKSRMRFLQTTEKIFKTEREVSDYLKSQLEEIKPAKGKRHVIIPIEIQDGPERAKSPWHKPAKLGPFTKRLISGAVKVLRPGVFLFVAAGKDARNKAETFLLMDAKKDDGDDCLPAPVEVSLISTSFGKDTTSGGGSAGSFQARNVETIFGQTTKAAGWRTLRKMNNIFDNGKTSFNNDLPLTKIAPRDEMQTTKQQKIDIWKGIEGSPATIDFTNCDPIPEEKAARRKWARKNGLNAFNVGYNVVSWESLGPMNWMELFKVCKAPVTYTIDLWGGSGKKTAASVSMPFQTRTLVSSSPHAEHILKVADLQLIREMTRQGSFWWEQEGHAEVESAFPQLFRTMDVDAVEPLVSDTEDEAEVEKTDEK